MNLVIESKNMLRTNFPFSKPSSTNNSGINSVIILLFRDGQKLTNKITAIHGKANKTINITKAKDLIIIQIKIKIKEALKVKGFKTLTQNQHLQFHLIPII